MKIVYNRTDIKFAVIIIAFEMVAAVTCAVISLFRSDAIIIVKLISVYYHFPLLV